MGKSEDSREKACILRHITVASDMNTVWSKRWRCSFLCPSVRTRNKHSSTTQLLKPRCLSPAANRHQPRQHNTSTTRTQHKQLVDRIQALMDNRTNAEDVHKEVAGSPKHLNPRTWWRLSTVTIRRYCLSTVPVLPCSSIWDRIVIE